MANLRDRLNRLKSLRKNEPAQPVTKFSSRITNTDGSYTDNTFKDKNWVSCGYKVLKREVLIPSPFKQKKSLPESLKIIIPDLAGHDLPKTQDFLFFDLETTGLSGGAGTVAFLAAFGRIISGKLRMTQYLLLDYPGENDFLENILGELMNDKSVVVSYNGKSFDSQILKTRCLMNRIKPPAYRHADLLHPSRRLWKNIIYDCSQGSIETNILGIDRTGDVPGSLAPEIWFEFLKTGNTQRLTGICEHNIKDISGLAMILSAMIEIADNPLDSKNYRYDIERLAFFWRYYARKSECSNEDILVMGNKLMRFSAEKNYSRAVYTYGYDQMRAGSYEEALEFVNRGLKIFSHDSYEYEILIRRKERLEKKLNTLSYIE